MDAYAKIAELEAASSAGVLSIDSMRDAIDKLMIARGSLFMAAAAAGIALDCNDVDAIVAELIEQASFSDDE